MRMTIATCALCIISLKSFCQVEGHNLRLLLDSTRSFVLRNYKEEFNQKGICSDPELYSAAQKKAVEIFQAYVEASRDASKITYFRYRSNNQVTPSQLEKEKNIALDSILAVRKLDRIPFLDKYFQDQVIKIKEEFMQKN